MKRLFSWASVLVPLLACLLLPPSTLIWIGDGITRGGGILVAMMGLYPLDFIRLLVILMAIHYAMELPETFARARVVWISRMVTLHKLISGMNVIGHFSIRVAVPVLFCLIVEGGPHWTTHGVQTLPV